MTLKEQCAICKCAVDYDDCMITSNGMRACQYCYEALKEYTPLGKGAESSYVPCFSDTNLEVESACKKNPQEQGSARDSLKSQPLSHQIKQAFFRHEDRQMRTNECDKEACKADSQTTVPTCGFCEKPITEKPVIRKDIFDHCSGLTTCLHTECAERIDELNGELVNHKNALITFESGAVRYPTGRRYDLMSQHAIVLLYGISPCADFLYELLTFHTKHDVAVRVCISLYGKMQNLLEKKDAEILDLYAQALEEGSKKYGDRNWEKGIPESNLVNHAIAHAIKLDAGDTSEDHAAHLVWNVLTIIHFRLKGENDG